MSRFIFATAAIAVAILAPAVSHGQSQSSSDGQFIFGFDTFGDEGLTRCECRMPSAMSARGPLYRLV
jgi:hypothetical protein